MDLVLVGSDCYIKALWFFGDRRTKKFQSICEYIVLFLT